MGLPLARPRSPDWPIPRPHVRVTERDRAAREGRTSRAPHLPYARLTRGIPPVTLAGAHGWEPLTRCVRSNPGNAVATATLCLYIVNGWAGRLGLYGHGEQMPASSNPDPNIETPPPRREFSRRRDSRYHARTAKTAASERWIHHSRRVGTRRLAFPEQTSSRPCGYR